MEKNGERDRKIHVLAVPFPAPGHVNPLLQFCKRLVFKGFNATLAITKFQSKSMNSRLGSIQIDTISDGYDEIGRHNAESFQAFITSFKLVGSKTLADLINKYKSLGQPIDCIIYDSFLPWVLDVAKQFGIAGASFFTQQCAVNYVNYQVYHKLIPYPFSSPPFSVPGLPLLDLQDMPGYNHVNPDFYALVLSQFLNAEEADYIVVNTFYELEPEEVVQMSKIHPVRTIGPTVPSFYLDNRVEDDKNYGLNLHQFDHTSCLNWLNTKPAGSVVYVSFGTVATASPGGNEMMELAMGLKNSNCNFLWVVKANEEEHLPKNFIEEIAEKGLILRWSPQLEVLAHEATGCFITHCGWNSTLEALSLGVPMVAVPKWADQPTSAKYIQDVWKVGVRVKVDEYGLAGREEIRRCIGEVMVGERSAEIKKNSMKWRDLAKEAVSEGGSSDKNIDEFISHLISSLNG